MYTFNLSVTCRRIKRNYLKQSEHMSYYELVFNQLVSKPRLYPATKVSYIYFICALNVIKCNLKSNKNCAIRTLMGKTNNM